MSSPLGQLLKLLLLTLLTSTSNSVCGLVRLLPMAIQLSLQKCLVLHFCDWSILHIESINVMVNGGYDDNYEHISLSAVRVLIGVVKSYTKTCNFLPLYELLR